MKSTPIIYFVTPDIGKDVENWKFLIRQAVEGGVGMIQIRDKQSSQQVLFNAAREIQPLLKEANIPLVINDYVELALALRAEGVHLGQSDRKVSQARAMLGEKAIIGLSVETMAQAIHAEQEEVSYLAASPVFESKTKNDCSSPWGISGLKELCLTTTYPIFAIGGIHLNNMESILECGVAGVALISAIAQADCPLRATKELVNKTRQYAYSRMG